jgi:hypothetical protein
MEKEIKIDFYAREALQQDKNNFTRGINCNGTWYNVLGSTAEAVNKLFNKDMYWKGNTVKVEVDDLENRTILKFISLIDSAKPDRQDSDIVNLETLLNDAHSKGIKSIHSDMIAHNDEKKSAIFKVSVTMQDDKVFEAHGDADQVNTGTNIKDAYIRMAESRALVRALRWATNNAGTAEEELPK